MLIALAVSAMCAALMGFAIQRGGTCLVAAVDEVVSKRRATRLVALAEASLLVAAGMVVAQLLGLLPATPRAFALTGWTVAGGAIMGLGAYVAGSCVFGAVARIGNGEPAFLLVPAGFFLGCIGALKLGMTRLPRVVELHSPVLSQALLFAGPLLLLVGWRMWHLLSAIRRREFLRSLWSPHVATAVIGVTFVLLLLLAGPWNYTDYLAEAARHMARSGASRGLLLLALFGGALLGGFTAGRIRPARPGVSALVRCLAGGMLLGLGGSLVPGANDGLILLGLPLLYPHAWVAVGSMLATISFALTLQHHGSAMVRSLRLA
jgi:uncharacterized membrane protein YedE/YeeE